MFKVLLKALFPSFSNAQYTTVKYAFPLVIFTALFAGLAAIVTENDSFVTIRTSSASVAKDQEFVIEVLVTAHVAVNALDLVIAYPEDTIAIDAIDVGTSVITLWTEDPYAKNGNIYLRGGTFRKGFIGEHPIARIKAHAIDSGEAKIVLKDTQLIAGDGKGTVVATTQSEKYNEVNIAVRGSEGLITAKAALAVVTDTDGDNDVDLKDISSFMSAWFTRSNTYDFNGDGKMTIRDFSILLADSFFN